MLAGSVLPAGSAYVIYRDVLPSIEERGPVSTLL